MQHSYAYCVILTITANFETRDKYRFDVVCNIDMHALHIFYMLRYLTYATFPLIASFQREGETSEFSKEKYVIRLLLTRATTNYRVHRQRSDPGSCNDAGANFRGSSTRGYKLFNRSVCGTDMSCGCGRPCVHARAHVALPRLELAICAVVKGNGRCERTLPQVAG